MEKTPARAPVAIAVMGNKGYVWDAEDAYWLRKECGIVGAMVGGVAAFKQQNAVHGLPLELADDEVTLVVEKGWGELRPPLGMAELATATSAEVTGQKRPWFEVEDEEEDDDMEESTAQETEAAKPPWHDALEHGSHFEIVTTPLQQPGTAADGGEGGPPSHPAVHWPFPSNREELDRFRIFKDLHSKGYRITGGSKFGADFLLYPGDPTLYHAQFCVRLVPPETRLVPAMLAAWCRGSFQARKHLLLASVVDTPTGGEGAAAEGGAGAGELYKVLYTTFGPVDGFG